MVRLHDICPFNLTVKGVARQAEVRDRIGREGLEKFIDKARKEKEPSEERRKEKRRIKSLKNRKQIRAYGGCLGSQR